MHFSAWHMSCTNRRPAAAVNEIFPEEVPYDDREDGEAGPALPGSGRPGGRRDGVVSRPVNRARCGMQPPGKNHRGQAIDLARYHLCCPDPSHVPGDMMP